jgi:gliding motility-associated-like protein
MIKTLFRIIIVILLATTANGQVTIINGSGTTAPYGTYNVTVTGGGSFMRGGGDPCIGPPVNQYWCGATGPGSYTYTISKPVKSFTVHTWGVNGGPLGGGEWYQLWVNGAIHTIVPSDVTSYTECVGGGGPMYISTGTMMGPLPMAGNYNGSDQTIAICPPLTSFELYCNGSLSGVAYMVYIDTSKPTCFNVVNNDPCIGDTLKLFAQGDSTGATYLWRGPGGFTSTLQYPFIFPSTFADSGRYYCTRTIGAFLDSDSTYVVVHPLPTVLVNNNSPLCAGLIDTLQLNVNLFSPGETFLWTGPYSFTSTLQNPTIPGFLPFSVGVYTVVATTSFGCVASGTINVSLVAPPSPPVITGTPAYCFGQPFAPFSVTGYSGTLEWYTTAIGGTSNPLAPTINTSVAGTTTVYVSQRIGSCESGRDSFTVLVRPQIIPEFTWHTTLGCESDVVTFTNLSNASWYTWEFGDLTASTDTFTTTHTFMKHQVQTVRLRAYIPGCELDTIGLVNTTHSVHALFQPIPDTMCAGQLTIMNDSFTTFKNNSFAVQPYGPGTTPNLAGLGGFAGILDTGTAIITNLVSYSWNFGDGTTDNVQSPHTHIYNTGGKYRVTLSVTDSIGCSDSTSRDVYVLQYGLQMTHDTMLCISQPLPLNNTVNQVLQLPTVGTANDFTYIWQDADKDVVADLATGETPENLFLDKPLTKVPHFNGVGVFTYTFTVTENQFGCYATDTIHINSVKGVVLQNVTGTTTIPYGNSIQINADSEVIYMWKPDDGSLSNPNINNPVAKPTTTTIYTVYGYDHNGCLDSAFVHIIVDSTMTEDIPSGFTPNGDGLNDVFRPVGLKFQNMVEFRVYNRWGQQLFYSNNNKVGWDGTFNGVPQDMGVYYYSIIVARPGGDGANLTYKGEITLIR